MTIEANISSYKKNRLKMFIVACLVLGAWCVYDGYFNQKWIADHTGADGSAETYLVFNRRAPYFLAFGAVLLGVYLASIVGKKVVADEDGLMVDGEEIKYAWIIKLDKTYFDSKGYFILTYKTAQGDETVKKISDLRYDNLKGILDRIVSKIS